MYTTRSGHYGANRSVTSKFTDRTRMNRKNTGDESYQPFSDDTPSCISIASVRTPRVVFYATCLRQEISVADRLLTGLAPDKDR